MCFAQVQPSWNNIPARSTCKIPADLLCCTNADIFCYLHQRICPTVALQESLCKWDTYNLKKKAIIYFFSHMLTELLGSASAWQYPGKTPEESVLTRQASHVVGVEEWWSWEQSRAAERGNCWDCTSTTATDTANTTNLTNPTLDLTTFFSSGFCTFSQSCLTLELFSSQYITMLTALPQPVILPLLCLTVPSNVVPRFCTCFWVRQLC